MSFGKRNIAVLGAGIQGCCTALAFRESGVKVDLYDKEAVPVSRASRWNILFHDDIWHRDYLGILLGLISDKKHPVIAFSAMDLRHA